MKLDEIGENRLFYQAQTFFSFECQCLNFYMVRNKLTLKETKYSN